MLLMHPTQVALAVAEESLCPAVPDDAPVDVQV